MTRPLSCLKCKRYVGEVRDATLMKGIAYLCQGCAEEVVAPPKQWDGFNDLFQTFGKNKDK